MRYDISIFFFAEFWPPAASRGDQAHKFFLFMFLFRKGHHCGNKLFPFSVSVNTSLHDCAAGTVLPTASRRV